jgi:hypothetical protein
MHSNEVNKTAKIAWQRIKDIKMKRAKILFKKKQLEKNILNESVQV